MWTFLHNETLRDLHCALKITAVIRPRRRETAQQALRDP